MIVTVTTLVWIIVTYVTQPESSEVLQNFYKKIKPGGPGWKKVILEARKRNIEIMKSNILIPNKTIDKINVLENELLNPSNW